MACCTTFRQAFNSAYALELPKTQWRTRCGSCGRL
ncbi:hypothetical protein AK812_SmicGene47655, partial [Symbiodinium microadriaticum]